MPVAVPVVGSAHDGVEAEADRIADRALDRLLAGSHRAEETAAHRVARFTDTRSADARSAQSSLEGGPVQPATRDRLDRASGTGRPLPGEFRRPFEAAFGTRFADVRVHDGRASSELNREFGAQAFTTGRDIFLSRPLAQHTTAAGLRVLGHELAHTLQERTGPTTARRSVLRRDVGFELEFDHVEVWDATAGRAHALAKKDNLFVGTGFTIEADETQDGKSDLEFVTAPFPETPAGAKALGKALNDIGDVLDKIASKPGIERSFKELPKGKAVSGKRFQAGTQLKGKPQATAGVRLDAMDRLFEEVAQRDEAPNRGNTAASVFGGQVVTGTSVPLDNAPAVGIPDVRQARRAVHQQLGRIDAVEVPGLITGPEITALATQLVMYLAAGAQGTNGYAKLIARGFMQRTDFATVYREVPKQIRNYFTVCPEVFIDMVLQAAAAAAADAGYAGAMAADGQVFEGRIYNNPGDYQKVAPENGPALTRRAWLQGILNGQDLLTKFNPGFTEEEKNEVESLGSYRDTMDRSVTGQNLPLVEFRGLKPVNYPFFPALAVELYKYVHTLNTLGREGYPGIPLTNDDYQTLVGDRKQARALRKKLIADALAGAKTWGR